MDTRGSGMFKVGIHIKAGEYKLESTTSEADGYYAVYSKSDHDFDSLVSNQVFTNSAYVTVSDGQYLLLSRCKIAK